MLRISTDKPQASERATIDTTASETATGNGGEPPTVAETATTPRSSQTQLEGNHAARVLPWITEEIRFHAVLDMGCGDGEAVRMLQEAGYDAHGVDKAPSCNLDKVVNGDFFETPHEAGYFDLVICCNVLQEIPNHRIPNLLAEIDRLSNSYVVLTAPSTECEEPGGETREVSWWTDRIRDFGWRFRIIREDPETGQMVILAEKANSLAAQILPLLDAGELDPQAEENIGVELIAKLDDCLASFAQGDKQTAFTTISEIADALLGSSNSIEGIKPLFTRIVKAMEDQNDDLLVDILENELKPALAAL